MAHCFRLTCDCAWEGFITSLHQGIANRMSLAFFTQCCFACWILCHAEALGCLLAELTLRLESSQANFGGDAGSAQW